jgi:CheY-like chemotaxis protein
MSSILIVDDDNETCRFMAELLSGPDRQIHAASRPDTALAMMRGVRSISSYPTSTSTPSCQVSIS